MKKMLIPKADNPLNGNITLESVDVIKFFESNGRKIALHESLYTKAIYKYIASDYLTGRLIVNSKTKAGAIREAHKIMQQAIDMNHDFGQYIAYNSTEFGEGIAFAIELKCNKDKLFISGLYHYLKNNEETEQ